MDIQTSIEIDAPATAIRLALAYQISHAIYVATRLGVWDLLAVDICTVPEIASRTGSQAVAMRRLLRALAAFDLVREAGDGKFTATPMGQCMARSSPCSVQPLILMFGSEHARQMFGHLEACITSGRSAFDIAFGSEDGFGYLQGRPDLLEVFNNAMSAASQFTGGAIAKYYDFGGHRHVVDVGGGHGEVLAKVLSAHPHLRGTLLEMPSVAEGASKTLAATGLRERSSIVSGDMFKDVPAGADLYFLVHIIHNWDDEHAKAVLKSCRQAMSDRGRLVIVDRVMPEHVSSNDTVRGNVLIDLMMMVRTPGGRERTAAEFVRLFSETGLQLSRITPLNISEALVEASPA